MNAVKRYWIRLNVIVGYPLMLFLDCMIVLTTNSKWVDQRMLSETTLNGIWNKYNER